MGSVPSGTVTFLFTDIEGSTMWWEREPTLTAFAVERHDAIVRAAIERCDGFVFSTGGDAFAAAFSRAGAALRAAVDAQRALQSESWPAPVEIRVRMGLHSGEAQERDRDYFGPTLNRAARIMARARGGQILLSLATEELVRDQLAGDVELLDLGEHRLASLQRPERVFQVIAPGLARGVPVFGRRGRRREEGKHLAAGHVLRRPDNRAQVADGPLARKTARDAHRSGGSGQVAVGDRSRVGDSRRLSRRGVAGRSRSRHRWRLGRLDRRGDPRHPTACRRIAAGQPG